jgi:hypothetical protein
MGEVETFIAKANSSSEESYAAKWHYVRQNPIRAGLVTNPGDWLYAGEIVRIDRR